MAETKPTKIEDEIKKPADPIPSPADVVEPAPTESKPAEPLAGTAPAAPAVKDIDPDIKPVTVEDKINAMTESGSKYVKLAEKDAMRAAASRGLINSTMAAGAGREAAIRASFNIASQDAAAENRFRENVQSTYLNIQRDNNSARLNESLATLESSLRENEMTLEYGLKTDMESTLQSERFSDDAKIRIVEAMNQIMRDAQQQITEIGLSDRKAEAQAAAIRRVEQNRNAQLAVYQELLKSFPDWEWGTSFTPSGVTAPPPPAPSTTTGTTIGGTKGLWGLGPGAGDAGGGGV